MTTHAPDAGDGPLAQFLVFDAPLTSAAAEAAWAACANAPPARARWTEQPARAPFDAAIATIHRAIAAGEVYQVNHTAALSGVLDGDPLALFGALRAAQPNAYAAYIDATDDAGSDAGDDAQRDIILSVSPELFFDWRGGRLLARPMKGTAPRGHDASADAAAKAQLLHSDKERAENLVIVDLLRNDLSHVAEPFSVQVPRPFEAEAWPTVWQLTSDVTGRTRAGTKLLDVLRALFPCGSVTGAPKVQAMRLIRALEPAPRGIYCGAIGVLQPGGAATFNVPIRTVTLRGRTLRFGIGSGITGDARADAEWAEWRHKRAFLERASQPLDWLETLRLEECRCTTVPRISPAWPRRRRTSVSSGIPKRPTTRSPRWHGRWRVRLLAARHGTLRAQAFVLEDAAARPPLVQLAPRPLIGHG